MDPGMPAFQGIPTVSESGRPGFEFATAAKGVNVSGDAAAAQYTSLRSRQTEPRCKVNYSPRTF